MRSSALLLVLAGCDLAFGVHGDPPPCSLGSFTDAVYQDLEVAEDYSVDWEQTFAVIYRDGKTYHVPFGGEPAEIDLSIYVPSGFALAPEGNAMFFTAMVEPPLLQGALRTGDVTWQAASVLPRGFFAGTPSADVFGPRRVLVTADGGVREYEDDAGRWIAVGEPHAVDSERAPNLTPDGLAAVYAGSDGIYAMTRPSTSVWFDAPVQILAGADRSPQLLGRCERLYTTHEGMLRRWDR